MSKNNHPQRTFDPSTIKPLDGSPMMSANCWNAVLETVDARAREGKQVRCLEWGAGNSTVSLARKGRKLSNGFEFISVEHETNFFHWLAESILAEFLDGSDRKDLRVTWQPIRGAVVPLTKLGAVLKAHRGLECASLDWQILLGNRRLQYIERNVPRYDISFLKLLKQCARLALLKMGYALALVQGVWRAASLGAADHRICELDAPTLRMEGAAAEKGAFFKHFEKEPAAGRFVIEQGGVRIELWHLPVLENVFWNKGVLLDGSIRQLFEYVCVPLQGAFDVVFIDGRARVSCIKRTHRDALLKPGGSLFVHDAFRSEMMEGFRLFGNPATFIRGTNTTLNGQRRCGEDFGMPLARVGDDLHSIEWEIVQEMYMHRDARDHAAS